MNRALQILQYQLSVDDGTRAHIKYQLESYDRDKTKDKERLKEYEEVKIQCNELIEAIDILEKNTDNR
jgi:hypothetical protein